MDAAGHCWVATLANYNFALSYQLQKMNVNVDTLSHILGKQNIQHINTDTVCVLISHVVQDTTCIQAYSSNIIVTETLDMQKDPKAMSLEDLIRA